MANKQEALRLNVCRGVNVKFYVQVRPFAVRKWEQVGRPTKSYRAAVKRMAKKLINSGYYVHGRVIMVADYYEPVTIGTMQVRT